MRVLVLWLALLGATVATRNHKHIRIELPARFLNRNTHRLIQSIVRQISAWTCLVIAWYGSGWVRLDYLDGMTSFLGIPSWMLEVVVPVAFALIGSRYFLQSIGSACLYRRHLKVTARASR